MQNTENFYNASSFPSIERVILAKEVKFNNIKNIQAEFFVPIMTPSVEQDTMVTKQMPKPSNRNIKGNLDSSNYKTSNTLTLTIPAHLLWSFIESGIIEYNWVYVNDKKAPGDWYDSQGNKSWPPASGYFKRMNIISFGDKHPVEWKIPKGTTFLAEFVGGNLKANLIRIIGIY